MFRFGDNFVLARHRSGNRLIGGGLFNDRLDGVVVRLGLRRLWRGLSRIRLGGLVQLFFNEFFLYEVVFRNLRRKHFALGFHNLLDEVLLS